jgi:hypothetical protein
VRSARDARLAKAAARQRGPDARDGGVEVGVVEGIPCREPGRRADRFGVDHGGTLEPDLHGPEQADGERLHDEPDPRAALAVGGGGRRGPDDDVPVAPALEEPLDGSPQRRGGERITGRHGHERSRCAGVLARRQPQLHRGHARHGRGGVLATRAGRREEQRGSEQVPDDARHRGAAISRRSIPTGASGRRRGLP